MLSARLVKVYAARVEQAINALDGVRDARLRQGVAASEPVARGAGGDALRCTARCEAVQFGREQISREALKKSVLKVAFDKSSIGGGR
eukprot:4593708-Pleurochrysis_carterae.AAC.3